MNAFTGLTSDTFAAYSPEKWSSNVHNLTRMRVKEQMVALCDAAQTGLTEELSGLVRAASDEVPNITNHKKVDAQWIYWFRDAAAREHLAIFLEKTPLDEHKLFDIAPQDKHIAVAVILRPTEVWTGLRLGPGATVDRRNFAAILAKTWEREQLLELARRLPEGAAAGPDASLCGVAELTVDRLAEIGHRLGGDDPAWSVGGGLAAERAIALGAGLAEHVRTWLRGLVPIYRFLAWTKSNDHIDVNRQLQEEKVQKRRQALGLSPGDKVRLVAGVFAGKTGVVVEIDTKAQVKVQIGKMSIVVAGSDLTPLS
jgi:hypothetical protein